MALLDINSDCFELVIHHVLDETFVLGAVGRELGTALLDMPVGNVMVPALGPDQRYTCRAYLYREYLAHLTTPPDNPFNYPSNAHSAEDARSVSLEHLAPLMCVSHALTQRLLPFWKAIHGALVTFRRYSERKMFRIYRSVPPVEPPMEWYYVSAVLMIRRGLRQRPLVRAYSVKQVAYKERTWYVKYPSAVLMRGSDPRLLTQRKGVRVLRVSNGKHWERKPRRELKKELDAIVATWGATRRLKMRLKACGIHK